MRRNSKDRLIRRTLIVGLFSAEFILAFTAIASGTMAAYGVAAVGGAMLPLLAGAK